MVVEEAWTGKGKERGEIYTHLDNCFIHACFMHSCSPSTITTINAYIPVSEVVQPSVGGPSHQTPVCEDGV